MIKIENLSKTYKSNNGLETNALKNINLTFNDTGLVFIVGKSGSGKTTLLNILGSLDSPDTGKIVIDNYDISNISSKMSESYRNTYVGFVFQEFNLLDEFNVFENINISLKLNKIDNPKKVSEVLKSVDLEGLETRNINELSGGQKQRVSLARAIVKDPKLILADEPTGNLDRKSSDQILKILKTISKNHLVIVVSHDIESANTYADRIIRIEDGEVISDNGKSKKNTSKDINLTKSNLPLSYIFKMSHSYIMSKPVRLVLTILITMISLSFMCFSINTFIFDDTSLLINTMKDNGKTNIKVEHYNVIIDGDNRKEEKLFFNNEDINYIKEVSNSIVNPAYILYENGSVLHFSFGSLSEELLNNDAYNQLPSNYRFVVLNDNKIISNIIGNYPKNNNEIVVHKYFADSMINAGIYDINNELYKPSSYQEIISSNKEIKLADNSVIISGIVDDDVSKYERVFKTGNFWDNNLKQHYNDNYYTYGSVVYVNKEFVDNITLSNELNTTNISLKYNDNTNSDSIKVLNESIEYIDLNGNEKNIDYLNEEEVIISLDTFSTFINNYQISFNDYLKDHSNMVYSDILKKHLKFFLKNNNINNNIILNDSSNGSFKSSNKIIIGINMNSNYISNKYTNTNNSLKTIDYLVLYCTNKKDAENVFKKLDVLYTYNYFLDGNKYRVSFDNSISVSGVLYAYGKIKRYLLTTSLIFLLFSLLLIYNFISSSIDSYKKQIGILRSIGTRNIDIIKIFIIETLSIGFVSWLFGTIIWIVECISMNKNMFGSLYFKLNGIVIKPVTSIIVLIFDIVVSLMITTSLINKINKIKPIDVILNRFE